MIAHLDRQTREAVLPAVTSLVDTVTALAAARPRALDAVAATGRLAEGTDTLLRTTVALARTDGTTWADIGGALGSSRQAAFQRFGRTGAGLTPQEAAQAATRAVEVLMALAGGDFDGVTAALDARMAASLTPSRLAGVWAGVTGSVGQFERIGRPAPRRVGGHLVVDVPMSFEAGEMVGRVALDESNAVAGLFLLHPEASR